MKNRNGPCPCGSGKKYKKCCGQVGLAKHNITVGGTSLLGRIQSAVQGENSGKSLKDRVGFIPKEKDS